MKWLQFLLLAPLVVALVIGTTTGQGFGNGNLQINQENNTLVNVTVNAGQTAILPCEFPLGLHESSAQVNWIRRRDWHIISSGIMTFTNDPRFSVLHPGDSQEWQLIFKYIQQRDQGTYECQISDSSGVTYKLVNLEVVEPKVDILGDYSNIEAGSTIKIVCMIESLTPVDFVFWYKNERMINYDTERGGISIATNKQNDTYTTSELYISEARIEDNGNYTCNPRNARPTSVKVVVSDDMNNSTHVTPEVVATEHTTDITEVMPNKLQITTARTLSLVMDNMTSVEGPLLCGFTAFGKDLKTQAKITNRGVSCTTPRTDFLPQIPVNEHHFVATLSVRKSDGSNSASTNFTFFDCNTYSTCSECVSSPFPCDWCVDGHRCTHNSHENCRNDILINGANRIGPSIRSGPSFCPRINPIGKISNMMVSSGTSKSIRVKVDNIAQFIIQNRFVCQFNIEGRVSSVNAQLLSDTLYCDDMDFTYTTPVASIIATFAVIWGGSKPLDNPHKINVHMYKCHLMADNCGICLNLKENLGCGWCQSTEKCEIAYQCPDQDSWLNRNNTCPSKTDAEEDIINDNITAPQTSSGIPVVSLTLGSSLNPDGIEEGDDVYFECNLTGDSRLYQNSRVSWYHNRRQLTHRDQGISISKEKMVIQQMKHNQAGNYYCLFYTNEGDFESNTISLKIQYTDRTFDINDKTPYFINRPLPMQTVVDLDAAPNTTVFTLQARDADKDHDIHYWLVRDRSGGRFEVDENSGEVRTRGYERFQPDMEYILYVKAEDQNGRVNASRQRFQLTGDERVAIRNKASREEYQSTGEERLSIVGGKRPPQFYLPEYEKSIPKNLVKGGNIITVKAKSFADHKIHYSLKALGQGAGNFIIGATSGIVKLAKQLDYEDLSQPHIYLVEVTATEEADGLSTSVDLSIKVTDVDEAIEGADVDGSSLRCSSHHNTVALLEELEQLRQELQYCRQQNGCTNAP